MTADDFVAIARQGPDKLRVDNVVLKVGERAIRGKGMLLVKEERFEINLALDAGQEPPPMLSGIFTKKDHWKLTGVIEDDLEFKCDSVSPYARQRSFDGMRLNFSLHPLDLIPSGWDAMSPKERRALAAETLDGHVPVNDFIAQKETQPGTDDDECGDVAFDAMLFEYPILLAHELKGEIDDFEFILRKDREKSDVRVRMNSKAGYRSENEQEHWSAFYALMKALAFVHGMHAWPYRVEYWRSGQKITDRVSAVGKLARTAHAPFTEKLDFNARVGKLKWDYLDTVKKATAFFRLNNKLSKEVAEILFLFREADNAHSEITLVALCALFENLVHLLVRELNLKDKLLEKSPALEAFEWARGRTLSYLNSLILELLSDYYGAKRGIQLPMGDADGRKLFEKASREFGEEMDTELKNKCEACRRMGDVVLNAQFLYIREELEAVARHLGLQWDGHMKELFKAWKGARNLLVHDKTRADQPELELRKSIVNESRIAGAINILLLRTFGYSGWVRASAFEDEYREI